MNPPKIKIINGDCVKEMKKLPANSVDSVITDPPYGLEFMGKEWDKFKITKQIKSQAVKNLGAGMKQPTRDKLVEFQQWCEQWAKEVLRVAKPGATLMAFGGTRTYHRLACAIEDAGWEIFDCIFWCYGSGFPKSLDISKQLDKGHKRMVVGRYIAPDGKTRSGGTNFTAGNKVINKENYDDRFLVTEPATPEAKLWNGWGTALKPAVEPIVVARKPKEGTYAENALKWGVAGLNIDGARIPTADTLGRKIYQTQSWKNSSKAGVGSVNDNWKKGRFSSNLILDQEAAKVIDEQSNNASRFFKRIIYTPKASRRERNAGCEELEKGNNHPTVKSLSLIEYLCTLTKTPTGGVVLDPFMGSGTTGIACINTGRDFIGIEQDKEYCKIAEARLKYWKQKQEEKLV